MVIDMRIRIVLLGLFLMTIVFTGCTTRETAHNLSNQDGSQSLQQPGLSSGPAMETPVQSRGVIHGTETWITSGNISGTSSPSAFFDYGENTSFALFHDPVTIQWNHTQDIPQSCLVTTNLTLINTGSVPVQVSYATVELKDDAGDGCFSGERFMCGQLAFGTLDKNGDNWLNPGESDSQTLRIPFVSSKSPECLTSQKFELTGVFTVNYQLPDGSITGNAGARRSWLIDLNDADSDMLAGCRSDGVR
jgi:hypothetical protein